MKNQIQMMMLLRGKMVSQQMGTSRDVCYWFGGFYVTSAAGLLAGWVVLKQLFAKSESLLWFSQGLGSVMWFYGQISLGWKGPIWLPTGFVFHFAQRRWTHYIIITVGPQLSTRSWIEISEFVWINKADWFIYCGGSKPVWVYRIVTQIGQI